MQIRQLRFQTPQSQLRAALVALVAEPLHVVRLDVDDFRAALLHANDIVLLFGSSREAAPRGRRRLDGRVLVGEAPARDLLAQPAAGAELRHAAP